MLGEERPKGYSTDLFQESLVLGSIDSLNRHGLSQGKRKSYGI